MSLEAITWAFRQSLTPSEKLVLLTLADYADDENKCWPKQETLSTRTGLTRPTIALKMKSLENAGLLTRQKRQYSSDMTFLNVDVTTTNEKTKAQTKTRTPRVFQPPTLDDVKAYAKTVDAESQADQFHEYYTVGNWKDSRGTPVKNWKQKFLTWKSFSKNEKRSRNSSRNTGTFAGKSDYGAAAVKAGNG